MEPNVSLCRHHFAKVTWKDGVRWLWNPINRRIFADRPEERVRLSAAGALIFHKVCHPTRLLFETGLKKNIQLKMLRTDLLVVDDTFQPQILIECKQPDIKLDRNTVRQALIYNEAINAPHVWLTNGYEDVFWSGKHFTSKPDWLAETGEVPKETNQWRMTGFVPDDWLYSWERWLTREFPSPWCHSLPWNSPEGVDFRHYGRILEQKNYSVQISLVEWPAQTAVLAMIVKPIAGKLRQFWMPVSRTGAITNISVRIADDSAGKFEPGYLPSKTISVFELTLADLIEAILIENPEK